MSDTPNTKDAALEPGPLRQFMVPDYEHLNLRLRPFLLDMAERVPDQGTNRVKGESYFVNKWLSPRNIHLLSDPGLDELISHAENAANSQPLPGPEEAAPLRIHAMWAMISRVGMEGKPHQHAGRISGAYYVDAGACDGTKNGAFAVYTPAGKLARIVPPKTGLMLLFPSSLWHGVLRYESDQPRIVVSFNLGTRPGPQRQTEAG